MQPIRFSSDEIRRRAIRDGGAGINASINGIDYLEVYRLRLTTESQSTGYKFDNKTKSDYGDTYHPVIVLHFFKKISELEKDNVIIEGGIYIKNIDVEWAERGDRVKESLASKHHSKKHNYSNEELQTLTEKSKEHTNRVLVVFPSKDGDSSTYTLRLIKKHDYNSPPDDLDIILSKINFTFNISGNDGIDCKSNIVSIPPKYGIEPVIDYMAKDYASFRTLMLGRIDQIMPKWTEQSPADMGIVLVELFAYVADHLSYFQDSVATEAYLATARRRVSLKRHARLLNYFVKDGSCARTGICLEISSEYDGLLVPKKTQLLTNGSTDSSDDIIIANEEEFQQALNGGAECFETLHDTILYSAHNLINLYTWGDSRYCLPLGATSATLTNDKNNLNLKSGDILIFEEMSASPTTAVSNPLHRHAVRLEEVIPTTDTLYNPPIPVIDITWMPEDALPFSLYLPTNITNESKKQQEQDQNSLYTVARGNVVLADHGRTVYEFIGTTPNEGEKFNPHLSLKPLTFAGPDYDPSISAYRSINYELGKVIPVIYFIQVRRRENERLQQQQQQQQQKLQNILLTRDEFEDGTKGDTIVWNVIQDILKGDELKAAFVTEIENDSTVYIRFGDGRYCKKPPNSTTDISYLYYASYRIGNGLAGNVGAESIARIFPTSADFNPYGIIKIRNLMAAQNGTDPENMEQIRQYASESTLAVNRAVTEVDYVNILERNLEVKQAVAAIQWTGSWYTVIVVVERKNRQLIDEEFKSRMKNYLNEFHLAAYDLEIASPVYVPLDIKISVVIASNYFRSEVRRTLNESFSNLDLTNGQKGFFHPDNLNFGQPILYSRIYEVAISVPGVISLKVKRFRRWNGSENNGAGNSVIEMALYEIPRLDNDPENPDNGRIEFEVDGGL